LFPYLLQLYYSIYVKRIYKINAVVFCLEGFWQHIASQLSMFIDWEEHHKVILTDSAVLGQRLIVLQLMLLPIDNNQALFSNNLGLFDDKVYFL